MAPPQAWVAFSAILPALCPAWIGRAKVGVLQVQGPAPVHPIHQAASMPMFRFGQPSRRLQRCGGSLVLQIKLWGLTLHKWLQGPLCGWESCFLWTQTSGRPGRQPGFPTYPDIASTWGPLEVSLVGGRGERSAPWEMCSPPPDPAHSPG